MRRRYIAVKIEGNATFDERDFHSAVLTSVLKLFGEYGASQAELSLVEYVPEEALAVIRCSHKALDLVKASIAAMTEIKNGQAAVHIMLVSGTLKSLRRKVQMSTKKKTATARGRQDARTV